MHLSATALDSAIRLLDARVPPLSGGDAVETGTDGPEKANG
jgi:hypothetical protein